MTLSQRSSLHHIDTVAFTGQGIFYTSGKKRSGSDSAVFDAGMVVELRVELSRGLVMLVINGTVEESVFNENLKDNTLIFRPYIEMTSVGDVVEIVQ
jgi:hypothetical protein